MKTSSKVFLLVLFYILFIAIIGNLKSTITYVRAEEVELPRLETITAEVTAYTSSVDETDDTPFLTASGETTAPGTIACPSRFKFGTMIQIEKRIFKCNDRMHKRFRDTNHFDIWVESKAEARQWGRKTVEVSIILQVIPIFAEK